MDIRAYAQNHILYLDGAMGTMLQKAGMPAGELSERWNVSHPDDVTAIHKAYYDAGSNVVYTNTFGANPLKFSDEELKSVIESAVANAFEARKLSTGPQAKFVGLDIGPLGKLLKPFGELDFEDAVTAFASIVKIGAAAGVDLIAIETMNDIAETRAALLAAKENSDLPVFVTNAYMEDGRLLTGTSPEAAIAILEGLGADAIGVNCSLGPDQLLPIVRTYLDRASVPVIVKPNAGMPRIEGGKTVYDIDPSVFAEKVGQMIRSGADMAGGCCGTSPEYIRKLCEASSGIVPDSKDREPVYCIASYSHIVDFSRPVLIGERLNPTGKKKLKAALTEGDMSYVLHEGLVQAEAGADVLDVNAGIPGIDEKAVLTSVVNELQAVTDLPFSIDTADAGAMESALRRYNGCAIINSVNGKLGSMEEVFPVAQKYGGMVIALTLDEDGIPETPEGRYRIAQRIVDKAKEYGIDRRRLIFDAITMPVSASPKAAVTTIETFRLIKERLGCLTSLGVSNISFGLPDRESITTAFFTMALYAGLDCAIMNPCSVSMMKACRSFVALNGMDDNCSEYIRYAVDHPALSASQASAPAALASGTPDMEGAEKGTLKAAVISGLVADAGTLTEKLIADKDGMTIVREDIIPALDIVGKKFEKKVFYLPQLLMSAEAAQAALAVVKAHMQTGEHTGSKARIVLATVEGDIHDIGKNIVKLLLENYGYEVIDLGKNVSPGQIVDAIAANKAEYAGLSALMTTTVLSMEETIRLIRKETPGVRVIVGGAVLTEEYAMSIGADKYGREAMDTVRYLEEMT